MKDGTTKFIIKDWATTYTAKLSGFDGGKTEVMLDTVLSLIVAAGHSKQSLDDLIVQKAYEIEPPQEERIVGEYDFIGKLLDRYPRKHTLGFTQNEQKSIISIVEFFVEIDSKKFDDAMMGNTGALTDDGQFLIYETDLRRALICGIEGRSLRAGEFD